MRTFPSQTSERKFPSSGGVPAGRGGSFSRRVPHPLQFLTSHPKTIERKSPSQPIEQKLPSQTSERKFPSSGGVPAGRGGSFSKNHSPTLQAFPQLLKLEKSQKNQPLRFPVTSLNQKKLLLKIHIKQYVFL
jgi:hypothetical protein